jgi:lipoprotein-releasing system ATP-binding protein
MLSLEKVTKNFTQGDNKLEILTDASLSVASGEMKALIGPSGSGKSTLLNIAGLLETPTSGTVTIAGQKTDKIGQRKRGQLRRSHIGFVFQFHRLLPEFSALENIMIPQMLNGLSRDEAAARAEQLLQMVGLMNRNSHRPGLLSGGEQQRSRVQWQMRRAFCWLTNPRAILIRLRRLAFLNICQLSCVVQTPQPWSSHIINSSPMKWTAF